MPALSATSLMLGNSPFSAKRSAAASRIAPATRSWITGLLATARVYITDQALYSNDHS